MRTMYDSTVAADIPRTAAMVAGYVDGVPRWSAADWNWFPNAIKVRIALDPATDDGQVLDVERGAANPDQAPGWVRRRRAAGQIPTVYCSQALWATVRAEFARQDVAEPLWWIAAYPGTGPNTVPDGAVAHQFAGENTGSGGHYDLSAVLDYWPGVDVRPSNEGELLIVGTYYRKTSTGDTAVLLENSDFIGSAVPGGVTPIPADDDTWKDMAGRFARNAAVLAAAFTPAAGGGDAGTVPVDLSIDGQHWTGNLTPPSSPVDDAPVQAG